MELKNTDIATIGYNTGKIKAIKEGTSIINVAIKNNPNVFSSIELKVSKKRNVVLIKITPTDVTLAIGGTKELMAEVQMADGQINSNVSWTSSDNTIASVNDTNGKVSALKEGSVTITATYSLDNTYKPVSVIKVVNDGSQIEPSATPTAIVFNPSSTPIPSVTEPSLTPISTPTPTAVPTPTPVQNPVGTANGIVKHNETNLGESGVTVGVEGTSINTTTDANGNFSLANIPVGVSTLVISKDKFVSQKLNITVIQNQNTNVPESILVRKHWFQQLSGTSSNLYDLKFVTANEGWAVGENVILHTTNGGGSWEQQNGNIANIWRGIDFIDSKNGWIVGDSGKILRTTDGGIKLIITHKF